MDMSQNNTNCIYNLLRTQFNESIGHENFFYYDLQYPSFFNMNNDYFYIMQTYLDNINSTIKLDVDTFIKGLQEEEREYNQVAKQNNTPLRVYKAKSTFAVSFNKNHILSVPLSLLGLIDSKETIYNFLYNYNYDLLTGKELFIKDVFNEGVNYIEVITNYVKYKINQNPQMYYPEIDIEIPDDQAFYLADDGIVIYFGVDEIAPSEYGIIKFKMMFSKFAPYINPRFYCTEPQTPGPIPRPRNRSHRRF
ncbi:DUF3298 and DUF4163 domain-containing protein [Clostridium sp. CCUG 7971]|uniref:DUF3298 and DUF4163 domain-containing protein n=1 Tax=Clostridium sp. CCUG 7971 TaxID=2811414 RepID=UPI001ABB118B|nr:DUF3298 and DUF4163 domain-containing protein [Clostridium sp. CCUG 7971]MBO3443690.1 DUF3298 and DUF4163 domain-containing protein [Clostridium sp. CCUG 7971]